MQPEHARDESTSRVPKTFRDVLAKESDNKHAHYCLGIILFDAGQVRRALTSTSLRSASSTRKIRTPGCAWVTRIRTAGESPEAMACYEKALKLESEPERRSLSLAMALRVPNMKRAKKLLEEKEKLFASRLGRTGGHQIQRDGQVRRRDRPRCRLGKANRRSARCRCSMCCRR